jgi:signal transduction histidine kinase
MSGMAVSSDLQRPQVTRVLFIEDDEGDFVLVREFLDRAAHPAFDLDWRRTLGDGLAGLRSGACDIALVDLTFPTSQGWDTFTAVRDAAARVPFVILTGLDDEALGIRATEEGAQDYLVKGSLTGDQLVRSIRYAIARYRAEQALRASESRLRNIIEQDTDAVVVIDDRKTVLFVNAPAARLFGKSESELTGTTFALPLEPGKTSQVTLMSTGDGREKVAEMNVVRTRWDDGLALIVSLRDITDRASAEEALKLYREELEDLVCRRTAELSEANDNLSREISACAETEKSLREAVRRLEEHDRAKSQFVFNVSHELKTPLTSLRHAVGNLLSGTIGTMDRKVESYVEMMREDCERLAMTVEDILDMGRIETSRLRLNMAVMPVDWCVAHAVDSLRIQARARRLTVETDLRSRSFVRCDHGKLDRVLLNIAGNAIKFNRDGGTVHVRTCLTGPENKPQAEIVVRDTGVGIPAEHLSHVGERFYRAGEQVAGSGLGLYISKEILEAHGGSLHVSSPATGADGGTEVVIRLPVAERPVVLVADDDPDCRRLVELQIGRAGYRVVTCGSGEEMMELVSNHPPAALIVDLVMPGLDGIGTIRRIKMEPRWRLLPVIAITGNAISPESRIALDGLGIPALGKPWEATGLVSLLHEVMWGHSYLRVAK